MALFSYCRGRLLQPYSSPMWLQQAVWMLFAMLCRAACLIATPDAASAASTSQQQQCSFKISDPLYWLSNLVLPEVRPTMGSTYQSVGLLGVANVDTFGDLVPPKALSPWRDGAFGWIKREGVAWFVSAKRVNATTATMP
eukprot:jgi/Chrzof1/9206/Cz03g39240.t1